MEENKNYYSFDFHYEDGKEQERFVKNLIGEFSVEIKSLKPDKLEKEISQNFNSSQKKQLTKEKAKGGGDSNEILKFHICYDEKNIFFNALEKKLNEKWAEADWSEILSADPQERFAGFQKYVEAKIGKVSETTAKVFSKILSLPSEEEAIAYVKEALKIAETLKKEKRDAKKKATKATTATVTPIEEVKNEAEVKPVEAVEISPDAPEWVHYDSELLRLALNDMVFLGRLKPGTLKRLYNGDWVCGIIPNKHMFNDCGYSDLHNFLSHLDVDDPDNPSFFANLTEDNIPNKLGMIQFDLYNEKQQEEALLAALTNKEFLFSPNFEYSNRDDGIIMTRADISKIYNSSYSFADSVCVPIVYDSDDMVDRFKENNFCISTEQSIGGAYIHTKISYVIVGQHLLKVKFLPSSLDREPCYWRTDGKDTKIICADINKLVEGRDYIDCIVDNTNYNCLYIKQSVLNDLENNKPIVKHNIDENGFSVQPLTPVKEEKETIITSSYETKAVPTTPIVPEEVKAELIKPEVKPEAPVLDCKDETKLISTVMDEAKAEHLFYDDQDILNFHIALKSSQLVILAGESGTGKTQLPLVYAKALGLQEKDSTLLFVPVSPSFSEPSDVLGYYKSSEGKYVPSSTNLVPFLKDAAIDHPNNLHIVIFDEMNLSQIEHWFSPFISIMERKVGERKISLYPASLPCANKETYPPEIQIGENVIFIGTINLDETTRDISDRLMDRSIVINLKKSSFANFYSTPKNEIMEEVKSIYVSAATFNRFRNRKEDYIHTFTLDEIKFLDELNQKISSINAQKGISFRSLKIMSNYLNSAKSLDKNISRKDAFDLILKQTILTKINGSDNSMQQLLEDDGILKVLTAHKEVSDFIACKETIEQKKQELTNYGFAR